MLFRGCTSHSSLGVHQRPVDGAAVVHLMECYLVVKRSETLTDATVQTSLGNTALAKEARTERPPEQVRGHAASRAARKAARARGGALPGWGGAGRGSFTGDEHSLESTKHARIVGRGSRLSGKLVKNGYRSCPLS